MNFVKDIDKVGSQGMAKAYLHETSHDFRLSGFLYVWLFSDLNAPPEF